MIRKILSILIITLLCFNLTKVFSKEKKEEKKHVIGPIYKLDPFIVNIMGKEGERFLKVEMCFELENEGLKEELNERLPQIRDILIKLLSSKKVEEVSTLIGKEELQREIISKINRILISGKIKNVYFTDFVMQ